MAKAKPEQKHTQTTGRRKASVARIRIKQGTGEIKVNKRPFDEYFPSAATRNMVTEPFRVTNTSGQFDIDANIDGGGISGQAGALRLAIARAISTELSDEARPSLKKNGLLTRDPREKESKKYGLKKARKAPQFSKR